MGVHNQFVIPNYVKAGSAAGLRRLMFRVNMRSGGQAKFFDIQFVEPEKSWFAWYYDEVKISDAMRGGPIVAE